VELTPGVIQELLEKHRETLLVSLAKMLQSGPVSAPSPAPAKAPAKAPKEKGPPRPPNSWVLFTMRVQKVIRESEAAVEETRKTERPEELAATPMPVMHMQQFASHLKSLKPYEEWTDEAMLEALPGWTPPETSKHSVAKAAKAEKEASTAASVASDSASDAGSVATAPAAEKPKRKWSDEAKASAAAKRAAKKAAPAADVSVTPVEASVVDAPEAPAPVPAAAPKTIAIKPKAVPAPAPPAKKLDLSFFLWTHEGKDYYTNDRGDVVTTDFEWVGRFDGKSLDEKVPEPADLSDATLRNA
jgi:hypothetical protein